MAGVGEKATLILGVGNVLMGDEGVGVHAVRMLEQSVSADHVKILDGGTGGFHLLSLFQEYNPIVLIDATMDEKPAGTVTLTRPRFASDFPRTLSAHDIGLRDLLESAQLIGPLPTLYLITVSIDKIQTMSMELSNPVKKSLPEVKKAIDRILAETV
ncbi:hydrogenase maturation protease [Sphingobacteriales bacterium CHB3]|nr:hydrogenase maturation protease [Sphingobacteriales bacterium CHB3]